MQGGLRFVFWAAIASLLSDIASLLLLHRFKMTTWPVGNIFLIVHFVLLFLAFDGKKNTLLKLPFFACLAFGVFNYFFLETPVVINSHTAYVTGIFMIIVALNYLYQLMSHLPVESVQTLPLFWLAFATLVYYGGTLFLFLFINYLSDHLHQIRNNLWIVHNASNILKNVFFFLTIWVNYKSKMSPL